MLDLANIEQYKENNRLEVKRSSGGLPSAIWETYSAFANTDGGFIILGVTEKDDKSFEITGVTNPDKMVKQFWDIVNNRKKINVNLLSGKDVSIQTINGKNVVVIEVPRAQRQYKPVYIDGNPVYGTYRRNGEGDYHCTDEELRAMYRDADAKTQDTLVLDNMDISVFCEDSIRAYRQRMKISRPDHVWEKLDDALFLHKIGAMGIGKDGKVHPTAAGLLMFGYEYEIVREYPQYFLDYREEYNDTHRWTDRIISSSGDWSGNLFDFFYRIYNRLQLNLKVPFTMAGIYRVDDTPIHKAIREALANSLVNADYYGRQGLVIIRKHNSITISNPGDFRVDIKEAESGGVSDPRNGTIMKLFNLINIGERAGSGIPSILSTWKEYGWDTPAYEQKYEPDRVMLSLHFSEYLSKKPTAKTDGKKPTAKTDGKKPTAKTLDQIEKITDFLKSHDEGKVSDFEELLGVKSSRVKEILYGLLADGIIARVGGDKNRAYRLAVISDAQ